jgi:CRISPR-associated protein (TIGR03984 family)
MTNLYGRTSNENITLQEALAYCSTPLTQGSSAIALLYSPHQCQFAKLEDTTLTDNRGQEIGLQTVFEARVFNEHCEMRWLNVIDGRGKAVIISDQTLSCLDEDLSELPVIATLEQTYLLWGEKTDTPIRNGWTRLATARIGALNVPVTLPAGKRVQLTAVEYLAEDDYGNVAVVEERLVKLEELKQ